MSKWLEAVNHFESENRTNGFYVTNIISDDIDIPLDVVNSTTEEKHVLFLNVSDDVLELMKNGRNRLVILELPVIVSQDKSSDSWNHFEPLWLLTRKTWEDELVSSNFIFDNLLQISSDIQQLLASEQFWSISQPIKVAKNWIFWGSLKSAWLGLFRSGVKTSLKQYLRLRSRVYHSIQGNDIMLLAHGSLTRDAFRKGKRSEILIIDIQKTCRPGGAIFDELYLLISIIIRTNVEADIDNAFTLLKIKIKDNEKSKSQHQYMAAISYFIMLELGQKERIFDRKTLFAIPLHDYKLRVVREHIQNVLATI